MARVSCEYEHVPPPSEGEEAGAEDLLVHVTEKTQGRKGGMTRSRATKDHVIRLTASLSSALQCYGG